MAVNGFNYKSVRAEKARIGARITYFSVIGLSFITVMSLIGGIALVALGLSIGWVLLGLSAIPAMIIEWKKGELTELIPVKDALTIDGVLEADILSVLPPSPSPYDIASSIGLVYSGHFFSSRFAIGPKFLQEIASKNSDDSIAIWEEASTLQKTVESEYVTAGILTVAIIHLHPQHQALLARLQLSFDDLVDGLRWQQHIRELINAYKTQPLTGGIARDWSFGWIPRLSQFGHNISDGVGTNSIPVRAHQEALTQLETTLSANNGRRNAVLVGQPGVGKTELVSVFARSILSAEAPERLRFKQIFLLDASALIARAPGRGELEFLVDRLLGEALHAKNVIVFLDNAQLFFEEGVGSVDLSNELLPILEAGRLPIILAIDDQRYLQITNRHPELASAFNRITVEPASQTETMAILQDQLMTIEFTENVTYMYQSLLEAYRLGERYIHDQAMPGRALSLLESAARYAEDSFVTAKSVQQAIEKTINVKVGRVDDDSEKEVLLNLETLIHERMINQVRAVSVVSDALRRARAGVRNQDRPIGTFLFVGPTGVGKTELSKALAEVYFGGEEHLIRLDMNEFVSNDDVSRLIADGSIDSSSLTAQVMKQPFSVILLDEIEKAHPNVVTTFLQVLDEGILRDSKNRDISFRDCIIIATSNAGADRIRENIERGLDPNKFEDQFIDELISTNQFKPEFLNRFDEIVMFKPLNKKELLQVVDLILVGINKTLSVQKVSVSVTAEAKAYLVDAGYDPRLGARPMRRVVQKAIENTVAKQLLSGTVEAGGVVEITLDQVKMIVQSKKEADNIANQK